MPGHRQSALLLHGLSAPDRRWVLEQLAAPDQLILNQHLNELKSLGIPADAAFSADRRPPPAAATLETASADQMRRLLAEEPVWLVRHLLALADWPWRDDFLATLPASQRRRMTAAHRAPLAPRAAQSLLAQLTQRLAGAHRMTPSAQPLEAAAGGLLQRLRRTLRRWR